MGDPQNMVPPTKAAQALARLRCDVADLKGNVLIPQQVRGTLDRAITVLDDHEKRLVELVGRLVVLEGKAHG